MTEPSAEDVQRLRESTNIIEKLIIINRFSKINSRAILYPILEAASQGHREIIEEVSNVFNEMKDNIESFLKSEITNENCFIRWTVVLAILKIGDAKYIESLIPVIGLGYSPLIELVLQTLNSLNSERFPNQNLNKILNSLTTAEKENVAYYAIRHLGNLAMDSTETLFALKILNYLKLNSSIIPIMKATHHKDIRIHKEAERVLKIFNQKDVLNACLDVLNQEDKFNAKYDFILPEIVNYDLIYYTIERLGKVGISKKKVRKILWRILQNGIQMEKITTLKALKQLYQNPKNQIVFTPEIENEITQILRSTKRENRLACINILGKLGEEWAISAILSYINDSSPEINILVGNTFKTSNQSNILDKAAYLLVDKNKQVRKATVRLFEELDSFHFTFHTTEGNIIAHLEEHLKFKVLQSLLSKFPSGDEQYKIFGLFWFGALEFKPAFSVMIKSLSHSSKSVILAAIVALGIFSDKQAIEILVPFVYETESEIRNKAIESIGSLGNDGLQALIHQLFLHGDVNPPFLEEFIETFGGRIMHFISLEMEQECNPQRKNKLLGFYKKISDQYAVKTSQNFKILL